MTGQWFSPDIPVSSTNKTDCYDFTEILLKAKSFYKSVAAKKLKGLNRTAKSTMVT
jgi:hypothetical protein